MKIKTSNTHVHGKIVGLPVVGEVEVSADGIVEVSDEVGQMLIEGSPNWSSAEEEAELKISKSQLTKALQEQESETLIDIATKAKLDEKEIKKASGSKNKLVSFLVKNLPDQFVKSLFSEEEEESNEGK